MFKGISKGWIRLHIVFSVLFPFPIIEFVSVYNLYSGLDVSFGRLIAFLGYWISVLIGVWIMKGFKEDKIK